MIWNGEGLKKLLDQKGCTISALATALKISRPTVHGWINGQAPKGFFLLQLCDFFQIGPEAFFSEREVADISIPLHRTSRGAKLTPEMDRVARELAQEYALFFKNSKVRTMVPVLRANIRDKINADILANELRKMAGTDPALPINYQSAFALIEKLGIIAVFRDFPESLKKSKAFYAKIFGHRVIFINADTNFLDLIFHLLHEAVHALRDDTPGATGKEEEAFCDKVASLTQFPEPYILSLAHMIKGNSAANAVIILKSYAETNSHALYGVQKRIDAIGLWPAGINTSSLHGAEANVRKKFPPISKILLSSGDARDFVEQMKTLSPGFITLLACYLPQCSDRKLGELLGLDNSPDASLLREELQRIPQK
jgi:transcriptional regulator with XRE-family HTH domain